jgi:hypothetical protein
MGIKKSDVFLPHLYSRKTPENEYKNQTFAKIKKYPHDNLMSLKFLYTLIMSVKEKKIF